VRQSVIANLGRAEALITSGALAALLTSGAKFTDQVLLLQALEQDDGNLALDAKRIGGPLLFARLQELGIGGVLDDLLAAREFSFAVERAVFVATLHRLFLSGSDRDCVCRWPITTSAARRLCACITFTERWRGSARRSRRRLDLRRGASRI
jgi:hypothetical protein